MLPNGLRQVTMSVERLIWASETHSDGGGSRLKLGEQR
jgi:hypothetical protein